MVYDVLVRCRFGVTLHWSMMLNDVLRGCANVLCALLCVVVSCGMVRLHVVVWYGVLCCVMYLRGMLFGVVSRGGVL